MMTVPMDSDKEKSSRERAERLLNKNVELDNKRKKAQQARLPSDPNTWQQMRENYEAIILEDHAFAEQHDIEWTLWQLHYKRIDELRALLNAALTSAASAGSTNGRAPVRAGPERIAKIRSQFKTFLSEATGFYHDLMLKIRAKYGLPLGYFSDDPENQSHMSKDGNKSSEVKRGLISCHRCLIYLGDLARYKGLYGEGDSKTRDFAAASSYYMQASSLLPSSGNPHHQLAILAAYSNDELLSTYRYFRSLAVENPFVTARDNLIISFEKNRQNYIQLTANAANAKASPAKTALPKMPGKGRGKGETRASSKADNRIDAASVKEKGPSFPDLFKAFSTRFVRLNGILFTRTSLETFAEVFSVVKSDLLELLSSGMKEELNFGPDDAECRLAIVRLVAILIFTVHNVNRENENKSYADILQRSVLLQNAYTATFEFMGYIVERCNQLNDPLSSYLLPGIMVFVEWLACRHDVAVGSEFEEKQLNARSFFWKSCIAFFNNLLSSGYSINEDEDETCFSNMTKYDESETTNRLALPEDFELRGFLPLLPAQLILDFSRKHPFGSDSGSKQKKSHVQRIIAAGKALANVVRIGQEGVYFDTKLKKFVFGIEPPVSDDCLATSSLADPEINGRFVENVNGGQMTVGTEPRLALSMEPEDEDEDEVIVFKPLVSEKLVDELDSKLISSEALTSYASPGFGSENGSISTGHDSFMLQNASSASMRQSAAVANSASPYLQAGQSNVSNWQVEQASLPNGFTHLNLIENAPSMKPDLRDQFGASLSSTLPVSYPQLVNAGTGHNYSVQMPQTVVPSKFDSLMSSGAAPMGFPVKPASVAPAGPKKNPVSRPVRRLGPPPGFGSVPSKAVDEPFSGTSLKSESPPIPAQMDNYSWLDGYNFPSANQSAGFRDSIGQMGSSFPSASSHMGSSFPSMSSGNSSMGMAGFPFPGKQASATQVQRENGWQDHQLSEQMKLFQEQQQQQFQNGNQQSVGMPQQYQGQSLWDGRFIV